MFRSAFGDMDEILKEIERLFKKEFIDLAQKAPRHLLREQTRSDGRKVKRWSPFVYGYSVTIGPDGKLQVREFGNVETETRRGKPKITLKDKRKPLVDVFTTNDEVEVVVELPGVKKHDIVLHGISDSITISVDTAKHQFHRELPLPCQVDLNSTKSTYKNGVLEIIFKKLNEVQKDELINID